MTRRHIIKGSSGRLPFAALNEYLCMQVTFGSQKMTGSKRKRSSKKFPRHAGNSTSLNLFQREMSRVFRSFAIG